MGPLTRSTQIAIPTPRKQATASFLFNRKNQTTAEKASWMCPSPIDMSFINADTPQTVLESDTPSSSVFSASTSGDWTPGSSWSVSSSYSSPSLSAPTSRNSTPLNGSRMPSLEPSHIELPPRAASSSPSWLASLEDTTPLSASPSLASTTSPSLTPPASPLLTPPASPLLTPVSTPPSPTQGIPLSILNLGGAVYAGNNRSLRDPFETPDIDRKYEALLGPLPKDVRLIDEFYDPPENMYEHRAARDAEIAAHNKKVLNEGSWCEPSEKVKQYRAVWALVERLIDQELERREEEEKKNAHHPDDDGGPTMDYVINGAG